MPGRSIESEKRVERVLAEQTKLRGGLCIKLATLFFAGLPDRLILLPGGIAFFVETKTTNANARKLQLKVHSWLINLGFKVYIIDTVAEVKRVLNLYVDDKNRVS